MLVVADEYVMPVERPRQPATDDWISLCRPVSGTYCSICFVAMKHVLSKRNNEMRIELTGCKIFPFLSTVNIIVASRACKSLPASVRGGGISD